jgi:hypothetical protein
MSYERTSNGLSGGNVHTINSAIGHGKFPLESIYPVAGENCFYLSGCDLIKLVPGERYSTNGQLPRIIL